MMEGHGSPSPLISPPRAYIWYLLNLVFLVTITLSYPLAGFTSIHHINRSQQQTGHKARLFQSGPCTVSQTPWPWERHPSGCTTGEHPNPPEDGVSLTRVGTSPSSQQHAWYYTVMTPACIILSKARRTGSSGSETPAAKSLAPSIPPTPLVPFSGASFSVVLSPTSPAERLACVPAVFSLSSPLSFRLSPRETISANSSGADALSVLGKELPSVSPGHRSIGVLPH
jgi:hypothetical protein